MRSDFPFSTQIKHHAGIALLLAIWLVLFLILFAPFDVEELRPAFRWRLLPAYGGIVFACYVIGLPLQFLFFQKKQTWNLLSEGISLLLFLALSFFASFSYYASPIMNGELGRSQFFIQQFLAFSIVISPLVLLLRWRAGRIQGRASSPRIQLRGAARQDLLQLAPDDLVCIQSADNYVEVSFLIQGKTQRRLLRNTLSDMEAQAPFLLRTHRSYLIHPLHFVRWVSPNAIQVKDQEVPVSRSYKKQVSQALNSVPEQ